MLKIRRINKFHIRSISPQMWFGENYKKNNKNHVGVLFIN